jgi:hypothetical protein
MKVSDVLRELQDMGGIYMPLTAAIVNSNTPINPGASLFRVNRVMI